MRGSVDLERLVRAMPGRCLVLWPDADFTIAAASAGYLQALGRDADLIGRPLAALFEGESEGAAAGALQASLQRVRATRCADTMPAQAAEPPPVNTPVLADDGTVELIVHRVHDGVAPASKASQDAAGLLDRITEGFFTLDRQWRFEYVNPEAHRILGRQPGELSGQVLWQAYPGLEGTEIERRYLRAMHQREKGSFTAFYAGHDRWYEITTFPAAEGISVFFRNVTEQKQMQAQRDALLAESERQRRIYETALDSTPDFVYVFDLDHRALYANAALLKTWGVDDVRGKRWMDLGYEQWHADLHDRELDQVIATRAPIRGEIPFTGTNGTRLYDYIFAPVLGEHGEVVAVAGTTRDVTERQRMTERLLESQRLEAIGTLAGGVAHDFNNMLAAILVNVALAEQSTAPDAPAAPRLALAHRAAERARSLVRQILTFSRRAPKLQQPQSLQPLVDEAVALLHSTLPPTVRLVVRPGRTPLWASVDGAQFQQTVVNLCTNAWQALQDERGTVRVSLAPVRLTVSQARALKLEPGEHVRLQVLDNGLGMDEAVRAHIFEPFFTTKPVGRGTGLGLAVVHGVVTESGGAIQVRSHRGRGTSIMVYLPRVPPPPADDEPAPPHALLDGAAAPAGRVLYVDDDEVVSLTAAALLTRAGLGVRCVQDGEAALAALRDAPGEYAAVVTDFNMPQMSGLAVAEAVRAAAPDVPVIIISGLVTDELQEAARRAGVREVLFKEHMLDCLVDAVRASLAPA